MAYRQMLSVENVLTVDGFYSVYHMALSDRVTGGELHDFYEVVYVESGFYYVLLDGNRQVVNPGSCVFFSPNTYHSGDGQTPINSTVRIISFECKSESMRHFDNRIFELSDSEKEHFFRAFDTAIDCLTYKNKLTLCLKEGASPTDLQYAKAQFEAFLLMLYKKSPPPVTESGRAALRRAEFRMISDYLKDNLHRPLTLDVIAKECSVSVTKLKTLCRLFADCGPIDYLISLRINRAKHLILEENLNFTEIAEKTGFASSHYFSRVFRDRTGLSPSQYSNDPNKNII